MRTIAIGAAGGLLLLALGIGIGRYTAPTRVEYKGRGITKTVEVAAKQKEETHAEEKQTSKRIVYKTKYVQRPDGTVIKTTEAEKDDRREERKESAKREVEIKYVDKFVDREVVKLTESRRAQTSIGVRGGISLDERRPFWGGFAERRLAGPVWAGVYASSMKEAGLQLRVEF